MTHKELIEMARISFALPEAKYNNLRDVFTAAEKKYSRDSRQYREGLKVLLTNYVEPQSKNISTFTPLTEQQKRFWG